MMPPAYIIREVARTALVSIGTVRNYFAGRLVSGWSKRRIEEARGRLGLL